MARINAYRDLEVWQRSMQVTLTCYRVTASFPRSEVYGVTSQLRRACVSIAANLAKGHNRRSRRAYLNHVHVALGSQAEVETLVELSRSLAYLSCSEADALLLEIARVGRMLHALARSLDSGLDPQRPAPNAQRRTPA
jgi:four helix bundle protein